MQFQPNSDQEESFKFLKPDEAKRLNLLADTDLYEMAMKFCNEDEFHLTKSKMNKLKGLIHTLTGVQVCDGRERIGSIIKYLRHQTHKSTIREEEKAFYEKLIRITNSDEGLRQFFHIPEFSNCMHQDTDGRTEKKRKKDKQDFYMYYFSREFLNHVIAEKMKGIPYAK